MEASSGKGFRLGKPFSKISFARHCLEHLLPRGIPAEGEEGMEDIIFNCDKKLIINSLHMKTLLLWSLLALALVPFVSDAVVSVKGYYRKDGTYVQPHYRSNPDGNPYNNWSFPGNTNPYTGETATGAPNAYLNNYYGGSSSGATLPSYPAPTATPIPAASPSIYSYSVAGVKPHHTISSTVKNWVDSKSSELCSTVFAGTQFTDCISYRYTADLYEWDIQYPAQTVDINKSALIDALTKQILALQAQLAVLMQ
jgi:hypothetical protein